MTADRWRDVYRVVEAMADLPPAERPRYADSVTLDDEQRSLVFKLLEDLDSGDGATGGGPVFASPGSGGEWVQLGRTIGRFRITGPLGRGGMSEVYAAVDTELDRRVALKFLSFETSADARTADRFVREARSASALNHPNIVTVHEVVRVPPSVAIVMEHVEGVSLRTLCGKSNPIGEVTRWGWQIADALAASHAIGLVHRDLKPENVMLRPDGYIKVLDFGLARQFADGAGSSTNLAAGTIRYLSPEQSRGGALSAATDIFAFGMVLYELATGVHPFDADTAFTTAHYIANRPAEPPSSKTPGLPKAFDELVLAMLTKEPAGRPAAAEIAGKLRAIAAPVPVPGTLAGTPRLRNPWKMRVAAGAGLLALGAAWFAVRRPTPTVEDERKLISAIPVAPSLTGRGSEPAFSPNSEEVAFAFRAATEPTRDIWVKNVAMGEPHQLSHDPADEFGASWSPDGREIAFLRHVGAEFKIVIMAATGGPERVAGSLSEDGPERPRLTWSGDGSALIVADNPPGRRDNLYLYRLDLRTGDRKILSSPELASDVAPTLSPDGKHLAFLRVARNGNEQIHLAPVDGGASRVLASFPSDILSLSWYGGGEALLYAMNSKEVYRLGIDGEKPRLASFRLEYSPAELTLARSGDRLAYTLRFSDTNVWKLDPAGAAAPQKLTNAPQEDEDPAFSPDGSQFVFSSRRTGNQELWLSQSDGKGQRQITADQTFSGSPAWSPDGAQIAYDSKKSGIPEIWIRAVSGGGAARKLFRQRMDSVVPAWSRDGQWVYFCSRRTGRQEVWKAHADGSGDPIQVTRNGGFEAKQSFDGKYLYYSQSDSGRILRMPVSGGPEELVTEIPPLMLYRYWDLSERGLYFIDRTTVPTLRVLDFATSQVKDLGTPPKPPSTYVRGLAVSPDGRSVLYVQHDLKLQEVVIAYDVPH